MHKLSGFYELHVSSSKCGVLAVNFQWWSVSTGVGIFFFFFFFFFDDRKLKCLEW